MYSWTDMTLARVLPKALQVCWKWQIRNGFVTLAVSICAHPRVNSHPPRVGNSLDLIFAIQCILLQPKDMKMYVSCLHDRKLIEFKLCLQNPQVELTWFFSISQRWTQPEYISLDNTLSTLLECRLPDSEHLLTNAEVLQLLEERAREKRRKCNSAAISEAKVSILQTHAIETIMMDRLCGHVLTLRIRCLFWQLFSGRFRSIWNLRQGHQRLKSFKGFCWLLRSTFSTRLHYSLPVWFGPQNVALAICSCL